jgi:hypothetical protein
MHCVFIGIELARGSSVLGKKPVEKYANLNI